MTFLSGVGVFDWAHSPIMEDVNLGREKFGQLLDDGISLQKRTSSSHSQSLYSEDEVFAMIEQMKEN